MRISIITINYNNLEGLKKTVESVINQTNQNIEYIIVDGASSDGSAAYIQEMGSHFNYWVSQPDKGIYNAMNKGIDQASGEYLLFLNSGDWLYSNEVIQHFIQENPKEDIVYGNSVFKHPDGFDEIKIMPDRLEGIVLMERTLNHQCTFYAKKIFQEGVRYDESYKMLADFALYNSVLIRGGSHKHLDLTISNYDFTGFSSDPLNKDKMDEDRDRFYGENATYFMPILLNKYEQLRNKHHKVMESTPMKVLKQTKKILRKMGLR